MGISVWIVGRTDRPSTGGSVGLQDGLIPATPVWFLLAKLLGTSKETGEGSRLLYAKILFATTPATSVSRKSRPLYLCVSFS